jgi:MerR family transcriptional regulator, light-induced transcriptional regulator
MKLLPLMEQFTIKDLERLSGVKAHTLRVWERRYRIIKPMRTETNRRRYTGDDLRRLINISILLRNGFKISKVAALTAKEAEEKAATVMTAYGEGSPAIDSLVLAMFDLNTTAINEVIMRSVLNVGLEETIDGLVFPFMNRVGVLWQTGTVDPGYEHFVTNLFRARIISAIESLPNSNTAKRRAMLFLPENELHELPLLFYAWIVKKLGFEILYLGQMTPLASVITICNKWNPEFIITGTATLFPEDPQSYLTDLSKAFPMRNVLVGGTLAPLASKTAIANIIPIMSPGDLKSSMSGSSF